MTTLDRFSQPLSRELSRLSLAEIDEQNELNKRDLVYNFVNKYYDDTGRLPEVEDIQETFYHVELPDSLVQSELNNFKGVHRV